jgi:hypothetical protein
VLIGGSARIASNADLAEGGSDSYRVEVPPAAGEDAGRYLAVMRVALGSPPVLEVKRVTEADGLDVVEVDGTVVAFPREPERGPLAHGGYAWPSPVSRHVVVGLEPGVHVTFDAAQGRATIASEGEVVVASDGVAVLGL